MLHLAHVNLVNEDRLAIARDERARRELVRTVVAVTEGRLGLFNIIDEHLHLLLRSAWNERLADGVRRALRAIRPDLTFMKPHVKPIEDRAHLVRATKYILRQTDHHELGGSHPALWTGNSFADIVRARRVDGFSLDVLSQELPRLKKRELYEEVGLDPVELVAASDEALVRVGPARLVDLAAGVFAADPALPGRTAEVVRARALAARVALRLGTTPAVMAQLLHVTPRAVRYLAERHADDDKALTALRLRLALEERARTERRPRKEKERGDARERTRA